MIPQNDYSGNTIPIPKSAKFFGAYADSLAKLAFLLLLKTSSRAEYRQGFYIPADTKWWDVKFGSDRNAVKTAARSCEVFEFNDRYSNFQGNCFCQSIRLAAQFRTGETEPYELSRKPRILLQLRPKDAPSKILISHFHQFWLPDIAPEFDNPWQAFSWARIRNRHFYASRCEFGRFHSNFTAFKHRRLLQSAEPLAAIDICQCQMLILGKVAMQEMGETSDLLRWQSICQTDDIYQYLADTVSKTRPEAKFGLIQAIFSKVGMMTAMSEYIALEREFGALARYLKIAKKNGHQNVARDCQRLESKIMVDSVVRNLRKVPMITVHDELIVPASKVEQVRSCIYDEFAARGMYPRFKISEAT